MSKQHQHLEERMAHLEEQIAFLQKQVQAHSHNINDETVIAIVNFVKQDIARAFIPPAPQEPQEQVG